MNKDFFDVVEVGDTHVIEIVAEYKTRRNADAIEDMAVMRRGCDKSFFCVVPHDAYQAGDRWKGDKMPTEQPRSRKGAKR